MDAAVAHLDLEVVRAARAAGIPEDQIVEMSQLAGQGRPRLADFPAPSRPRTQAANPLDESDDDEDVVALPDASGITGTSVDQSVAAALAKLTEITMLS